LKNNQSEKSTLRAIAMPLFRGELAAKGKSQRKMARLAQPTRTSPKRDRDP
jgi:hypothetical protein